MNINELKNIIENGGATLAKNGEAVNFDRGYQVSKRDCFIFDVKHTRKTLSAINNLLNSINAAEFVGLWIDGGKIYIDLSERIERLSDAIIKGVERKQKSIFDWTMQRCIGLES